MKLNKITSHTELDFIIKNWTIFLLQRCQKKSFWLKRLRFLKEIWKCWAVNYWTALVLKVFWIDIIDAICSLAKVESFIKGNLLNMKKSFTKDYLFMQNQVYLNIQKIYLFSACYKNTNQVNKIEVVFERWNFVNYLSCIFGIFICFFNQLSLVKHGNSTIF